MQAKFYNILFNVQQLYSVLFSNKIDLVKLMHVIFYEAYYLRNILAVSAMAQQLLSNSSAMAQ